MNEEQKQMAVRLLQKCLPHLDLAISEHNDGHRLQRDICMFLAGLGYPGEWEVRNPDRLPAPSWQDNDPIRDYHRKVRQG